MGANLCCFSQRLGAECRAANPSPNGSWHMELNPELKFSTCSGLERQTSLFSLGIKGSPGLAWQVWPRQLGAEGRLGGWTVCCVLRGDRIPVTVGSTDVIGDPGGGTGGSRTLRQEIASHPTCSHVSALPAAWGTHALSSALHEVPVSFSPIFLLNIIC